MNRLSTASSFFGLVFDRTQQVSKGHDARDFARGGGGRFFGVHE